jgi:hypothetical protein
VKSRMSEIMGEKRYATLVTVPGGRRDIRDVGVFSCCEPGLCLYESLPGYFEILVLVECDPDCVSSRRNVQRSRNHSGVEINRSVDRDPRSLGRRRQARWVSGLPSRSDNHRRCFFG